MKKKKLTKLKLNKKSISNLSASNLQGGIFTNFLPCVSVDIAICPTKDIAICPTKDVCGTSQPANVCVGFESQCNCPQDPHHSLIHC
ncbi:hypothetical protein IMCC3317_02810 [Kordia antarctica]|uniref:Uncharacterized protein n=1 Tax=Kordia antarctica TaxID=1218801 RepID=A0A7L4ZFG3_9FLAO|nr:hypothetical protein [Kordia antarctica]QHI34936.1 hypothetical protein IMCC3317_02810 [Kordia antarctica]